MTKIEYAKLLVRHKARNEGCDLCPIAAQKKVFYRGSRNPKYLFIGEAPGPAEAVVGLPFVGPAGKILDQLFDEVGLKKGYGITNTICCFPFQEENRSKFRKPTKEEMTNCRPRLDDLIECFSIRYYISLGKVASSNPPSGIEYSLHLDHPSYILRSGGVSSNEFKRNKHRLADFLERTDG